MKEYLNYFPSQQILILTLEELSSYRRTTLKKVFRYLEIDDSFETSLTDKKLYQTQNRISQNSWGFFVSKMPLINRAMPLLPDQLQRQIAKLLGNPFSQQIGRPQLSPELRQQIIDLLQEDMACLRDYTGKDFQEWCV